ncbi:MAG: hypothetical protein GXP62_13600 [Oligoflexia bacterium]|nr:hypothetical protein [Oligoflexia bacterium]
MRLRLPLLALTGTTMFALALACGSDDAETTTSTTSTTTSVETPMDGAGTSSQPYVATCSDSGKRLTGAVGNSFYVMCPANCLTGSVWGTGPYTRDSSICTAAVHGGAVTTAGGLVKATILAGQPNYQAGDANGVSSHSWMSYDTSIGIEPGVTKTPAPAKTRTTTTTTTTTTPKGKTRTLPAGSRPGRKGGSRGH